MNNQSQLQEYGLQYMRALLARMKSDEPVDTVDADQEAVIQRLAIQALQDGIERGKIVSANLAKEATKIAATAKAGQDSGVEPNQILQALQMKMGDEGDSYGDPSASLRQYPSQAPGVNMSDLVERTMTAGNKVISDYGQMGALGDQISRTSDNIEKIGERARALREQKVRKLTPQEQKKATLEIRDMLIRKAQQGVQNLPTGIGGSEVMASELPQQNSGGPVDYNTLKEIAAQIGTENGVPPEIMLGMLAAEGRARGLGANRNNFYNLGAVDSNPGQAMGFSTPEEGVEEFARFIKGEGGRHATPQIKEALKRAYQEYKQTRDSTKYVRAIEASGYAGDPATYDQRSPNDYARYSDFIMDTPEWRQTARITPTPTQRPKVLGDEVQRQKKSESKWIVNGVDRTEEFKRRFAEEREAQKKRKEIIKKIQNFFSDPFGLGVNAAMTPEPIRPPNRSYQVPVPAPSRPLGMPSSKPKSTPQPQRQTPMNANASSMSGKPVYIPPPKPVPTPPRQSFATPVKQPVAKPIPVASHKSGKTLYSDGSLR